MFVCLPEALPHACSRIKILMAPQWCCRAGSWGCRYPEKTIVLEIPGVKLQEDLVRSETKIAVRNEDPGGGVNVFVGVGNGLPVVLHHASPRLKIRTAPH